MFEDETVDVTCPKCGHLNTIQVSEFEVRAEAHFVCEECKTGVKVEGREFHDRLARLRQAIGRRLRSVRRAERDRRRPTTAVCSRDAQDRLHRRAHPLLHREAVLTREVIDLD